MRKLLARFTLSFFTVAGLLSCGPDEPAPNIHKIVEDWGGGGTVIRCCYGVGNQCSRVYWEILRSPSFRTVINQGEISSYFSNGNWQSAFPELIGRSDIVSEIISKNPKGIYVGQGDDEALVLLKDSTVGYTKGNTLFTFVQRLAPDPCGGYPGAVE